MHHNILCVFFATAVAMMLQGCASSQFSRGAASEADKAYIDADYALSHTGEGNIATAYQNTSQQAKGLIIGGAAGALVGSMSSGIGTMPGLIGGAIFGGALGTYMDNYSTFADRLENRGVKTIILGDQILLVLRSSLVFHELTANIYSNAYSTLDMVAQFINQHPNMMVKVAGYTSNAYPDRVNLAITKEQAQHVAKYLWLRGVDTRLLFAEGYGGTHLITKSSADWENDNNRIEITLEKLPV
jgi:outer membrane protein OmpA-like peptidoglycan-associated protein